MQMSTVDNEDNALIAHILQIKTIVGSNKLQL